MRVVINVKTIGLNLTNEALLRYAEIAGIKVWTQDRNTEDSDIWIWKIPEEQRMPLPTGTEAWMDFSFNYALNRGSEYIDFAKHVGRNTIHDDDIERNDPALVKIVEELAENATFSGRLAVIEIPDDIDFKIETDCFQSREIIVARWQ